MKPYVLMIYAKCTSGDMKRIQSRKLQLSIYISKITSASKIKCPCNIDRLSNKHTIRATAKRFASGPRMARISMLAGYFHHHSA